MLTNQIDWQGRAIEMTTKSLTPHKHDLFPLLSPGYPGILWHFLILYPSLHMLPETNTALNSRTLHWACCWVAVSVFDVPLSVTSLEAYRWSTKLLHVMFTLYTNISQPYTLPLFPSPALSSFSFSSCAAPLSCHSSCGLMCDPPHTGRKLHFSCTPERNATVLSSFYVGAQSQICWHVQRTELSLSLSLSLLPLSFSFSAYSVFVWGW